MNELRLEAERARTLLLVWSAISAASQSPQRHFEMVFDSKPNNRLYYVGADLNALPDESHLRAILTKAGATVDEYIQSDGHYRQEEMGGYYEVFPCVRVKAHF